MQREGAGGKLPTDLSDGELWRRSRAIDATGDDGERYLDLAEYADGRLDEDDRARIEEWLAADPMAAADVAAARTLTDAEGTLEPAPEPAIARACALVGGGAMAGVNVLPFRARRHHASGLDLVARWGSLAAAMAVASWLGFTLGMDTSRSLSQLGQNSDDTFLHELADPSIGFMRELTEGNQT